MAKKKAAKKKAAKKKAPARKKSAKRKPAKKSMKAMARKSAKKKAPKKRPKARKRELIDTGTDKRYVRRDDQGQFQDVVDVSRSLAADIRQPAETAAPAGMGNLGD